ncbi:MAG: hypothetical protein J7K21_01010 [Desulfurococcales archaeon]|nr:hypothetical protein [Desulfurococcales archaeon]
MLDQLLRLVFKTIALIIPVMVLIGAVKLMIEDMRLKVLLLEDLVFYILAITLSIITIIVVML